MCGTYFHKQGELTHWRTFDQMMVSSNFIATDGWFLDEDYALKWQESPLKFATFHENGFDHFPIISRIIYKPKQED